MVRKLRRLFRKRVCVVFVADPAHARYGKFGVITSRGEGAVWVCFGDYEPFFGDYASEAFFTWQVLERKLYVA